MSLVCSLPESPAASFQRASGKQIMTCPLFRPLEVVSRDGSRTIGTRLDRGLVHESLQVGSREPDRAARDDGNVDVLLVVPNVAQVVAEDLHATTNVGQGNDDVSVEPARSHEGFVERFGEVCSCSRTRPEYMFERSDLDMRGQSRESNARVTHPRSK